jgi:hypothetical protein
VLSRRGGYWARVRVHADAAARSGAWADAREPPLPSGAVLSTPNTAWPAVTGGAGGAAAGAMLYSS